MNPPAAWLVNRRHGASRASVRRRRAVRTAGPLRAFDGSDQEGRPGGRRGDSRRETAAGSSPFRPGHRVLWALFGAVFPAGLALHREWRVRSIDVPQILTKAPDGVRPRSVRYRRHAPADSYTHETAPRAVTLTATFQPTAIERLPPPLGAPPGAGSWRWGRGQRRRV